MKIALASKTFINGNLENNINEMISAIWGARAMGAELICFGEAFLQGFDALSWNYDKDKFIAIAQHSDYIYRICYASKEFGIDVMFGYIERCEDKLYSSYMLIEKGIIKYNYRRISKGWKEYTITDYHYAEGSAPIIFEYRGRKCAAALCGDLWEYQDRFDLGEEILFWPIYVNFSKEQWESELKQEYIEHSKKLTDKVLLINSLSEEPSAYGGCLYISNGALEKELEMGSDGLLLCDV